MLTTVALAQTLILFHLDVNSAAVHVSACSDALQFVYGTYSFESIKQAVVALQFVLVIISAYADVAWVAAHRGCVPRLSEKWFHIGTLFVVLPLALTSTLLFKTGDAYMHSSTNRALPLASILALSRYNMTVMDCWPDYDAKALPVTIDCLCKTCVRTCSAVDGLRQQL